MNFCENCGEKLEKESLFCENCGAKVENNESSHGENKAARTTKKVERKPLTKKQKMIGASIIALILLLFVGYKTGSTVYSRENQIGRMTDALVAKDSGKLADIVTTDDPNFEVNADNLESFTSYLEQNPNYLNELVAGLERRGSYGPFAIRRNGTKLGLYDAYELVMTPVYGNVYTNAEDVSISVGDQELLVSDSDDFTSEVGPFAPGMITFTAAGTINDHPLTVEQEVEWLDAVSPEVDLSLKGAHFTVSSDLEAATVYIDGEDIGQLIDGRGEFGPIQLEEGMELHVAQTLGDDEVVSDPIPLTEDSSHYEFKDLVIGSGYDVQILLNDVYRQASYLTNTYNDKNVKDFNTYFQPESPAYEDQRTSFLSFAEATDNNEDVIRVNYRVTDYEVERAGKNSFDVTYEVTETTTYDYRLEKEDSIQHYEKEMTIILEPTNHPDRDYDRLIYEIRNEELLYEEGSEEIETSKDTEEETAEQGGDTEVEKVVTNFVTNLPNAVNNGDFSHISAHIDSSSDFYSEQSSFVTSTHERGITERLDHMEILEVTVDGETAQVRTSETFTIYNEDSENQSSYEAVYDLVQKDGEYLITNLVTE